MPWWIIAAALVFIFILFSFAHYASKSRHPFKRGIFSMSIGAGVLFAINLTSGITGVYIPVSLLSLGIAVAGGVPGVTLLLTLNLILQ